MESCRFWGLAVVVIASVCPGCRPAPSNPSSDTTVHSHHPPHRGTTVELGKEEYHLELVHESGTSQMTAYILDGEMEKFIRVPLGEFLIHIVGQSGETLRFQAVGNPATGEKIGDSSEFIASSSWLTNHGLFDGIVVEIKIGLKTYQGVTFSYPKGNE